MQCKFILYGVKIWIKLNFLFQGDSGSPLLINNTIVGIISNSPDCLGNTEGWYTNVFAYDTWIKDVIIFGGQSIFSGYVREMKIISNHPNSL